MEPTPSQKAAYRDVLKPVLQAVKHYRGSEASAEDVLKKAIDAESWIKANFPARAPHEVERELGRYEGKKALPTFNDLLGRCLERLRKLFSRHASVESIAKGLHIPVREIDGVIIPPAPGAPSFYVGAGGDDRPSVTFAERFMTLVNALQSIGVYADDLIIHKGTLLKNQMREVSYLLVEIPRLGGDLLVCDQVGEATYVSIRPLGVDAYLRMTKADLMASPDIFRVVFYDSSQWSKEILDRLSLNTLGRKVNIENFLALRDEAQRRYDPHQLVEYDIHQRNRFDIGGHKLYAIASAVGLPGRALAEGLWLEVCAKIWGEQHSAIEKPLRVAREERALFEYLGQDRARWRLEFEKQFSAEQFVALPTWGADVTRRQDVRIGSKGLGGIATALGVTIDPLRNTLTFLEFAAEIWGREHPAVAGPLSREREREEMLEYLGSDPARWRVEVERLMTPEQFWSMPIDGPVGVASRKKFEILGLGIDAFARKLGVEGSARSRLLPFYEVCAKLWGDDQPAFTGTLKELRANTSLREGLGEDPSQWIDAIKGCIAAEEFASLKFEAEKGEPSRRTFHVGGKGLRGIGRIFGITACAATSDEGFRELFVKVWGAQHPAYALLPAKRTLDESLLDGLGTDVAKWRAEIEKVFTVEEFVALNQTQRYELKVAGLGLFALSNRLGSFDSRYRVLGFLELCATLWGAEHPAIKERLERARQAQVRKSELLVDPELIKTIVRETCSREDFVASPHAYRLNPRLAGLGPVTFGRLFGVATTPRWTREQRAAVAHVVWGGSSTI